MKRQLVVSADDYALTKGVSRAILRAHREGIVTSTSVLAVGAAFADTAPWLDDAPELGVGVHLCAVGEDRPLLSAREIPTLIDARGQLARSWRRLLPRLVARLVDPDDLAREFQAQIERVLGLGRRLTHLDTHQHLHLWPEVRAVVIALARKHGIPALRVPRSGMRRLAGLGLPVLAKQLARHAAAAGLITTEAFAGFDEAGRFCTERLLGAIEGLSRSHAASAEIATHPGEAEDAERARFAWNYRWPDELDALCAAAVRQAVMRSGFELVRFDQLSA